MIYDISHHNSIIYFDKFNTNDVVILKATENTSFIDNTFHTRIKELLKRNIPCFAYHFLRLGNIGGQMKHFYNQVHQYFNYQSFIGLCLDVEVGNSTKEVSEAIRIMKSYGTKTMLYIGNSDYEYYRPVIDSMGDDVALWVARYGSNTGTYNPSYPPKKCDLHQYTSNGITDAVQGRVDLSRITETGKEISWFLTKNSVEKPKNNYGLYYRTHVQSYGTLKPVRDGITSGTTGQKKRLEGLYIDTRPFDFQLNAKAHIQKVGWVEYKKIKHNTLIGTIGEGKRIEAIELELENSNDYEIYYQVHVAGKGWTGETKGGFTTGTTGIQKQIEAIRIWLERK